MLMKIRGRLVEWGECHICGAEMGEYEYKQHPKMKDVWVKLWRCSDPQCKGWKAKRVR